MDEILSIPTFWNVFSKLVGMKNRLHKKKTVRSEIIILQMLNSFKKARIL